MPALQPDKFLISGHRITGDDNGFALLLSHADCGTSFVAGFSGGAPTLEQVNRWASEHSCHADAWRSITADDLAAL